MWAAIRKRLEIFRDIAERPWFRAFIFVWGAVGAWDLVLSQFVPEEYSRNFPKLYQVVGMTAGWFSLWAWLMVGALSLVAGAIEWAFRHKKRYLELLHQGPIERANFRGIVGDHPPIGNPSSSPPIPSETIGSHDYHWQFDSQMADAIATRLRSKPEWQDKKIVDVIPAALGNDRCPVSCGN